MATDLHYIALVIYKDSPIWRVPLSQIKNRTLKNELFANKRVLVSVIMFVFENEKPDRILRTMFKRVTFDENGEVYFDIDRTEQQIVIDYIKNADKQKELPLLTLPTEPSIEEMARLKDYLNRLYPQILKRSPYAIESTIEQTRLFHIDHVDIVKGVASKLNNSKQKSF